MNLFYKIKKKVKSNDKLADVLRFVYVPVVVIKKSIFNVKAYKRKIGKNISKYISLKRYENIHKGKRCFIVATGPSLTVEDLELIRDEYTISMNSIYLSYANIDWRPTYYAIQDPFVYEKIQHELNFSDYEGVFIGSLIDEKFKIPLGENINKFALDLLWQQIPNVKYHTKFSNDIYSRVYSGYNVAYTALQIAVYMGFSEIYLIGADCNYLQDKKYFINDKNRGEEKYFTKKFYASNTNKFIYAYEVANEYAQKNGVKIYNATRGGLLDVYPRVNLDEVLN